MYGNADVTIPKGIFSEAVSRCPDRELQLQRQTHSAKLDDDDDDGGGDDDDGGGGDGGGGDDDDGGGGDGGGCDGDVNISLGKSCITFWVKETLPLGDLVCSKESYASVVI